MAKKISTGVYEYKGYKLICFRYYPPDKCVLWECVDHNDNAIYHAHTKKELMLFIDKEQRKNEYIYNNPEDWRTENDD